MTRSHGEAIGGSTPRFRAALQRAALRALAVAPQWVSPNKPSVAVGKTLQFSAIGTYTDASTQDLTKSVAWGTLASR